MKYLIPILLLLGLSTSLKAQLLSRQHFLPPKDYSFVSQDTEKTELKNKNVATIISVGATVSSYYLYGALVNAGGGNTFVTLSALFILVSAPSAGYLYSYNNDDFWRNTLHRTIAVGITTTGAIILFVDLLDDIFDEEESNPAAVTIGSALMIGGATWFFVSTIRDFIVVRKKVDEYNQSLMNRVQITPMLDPVSKTVGVGLRVSI